MTVVTSRPDYKNDIKCDKYDMYDTNFVLSALVCSVQQNHTDDLEGSKIAVVQQHCKSLKVVHVHASPTHSLITRSLLAGGTFAKE